MIKLILSSILIVGTIVSCNVNQATIKIEGEVLETGKLYGEDYPYNRYVIVTDKNVYYVNKNAFNN